MSNAAKIETAAQAANAAARAAGKQPKPETTAASAGEWQEPEIGQLVILDDGKVRCFRGAYEGGEKEGYLVSDSVGPDWAGRFVTRGEIKEVVPYNGAAWPNTQEETKAEEPAA